MDTLTDGIVQEMMRNELSGRTAIAIAHRIQTVITSDVILLMSNGVAVEMDEPDSLLRSETSAFRMLVNETGAQSSRHLMAMASAASHSKMELVSTQQQQHRAPSPVALSVPDYDDEAIEVDWTLLVADL